MCFLFNSNISHHPTFIEDAWVSMLKEYSLKKIGFLAHVGSINFPHNIVMHKWDTLRNPIKHIERMINTQTTQDVANNRLRIRLLTTIECKVASTLRMYS